MPFTPPEAIFNLPFGVFNASATNLDPKRVVADITTRNDLLTQGLVSEGQWVYVLADQEDYILKGSTNSDWESLTSLGGVSTLADLTDTTITSPTTNDLLQYDGSSWVNIAPSTLPFDNYDHWHLYADTGGVQVQSSDTISILGGTDISTDYDAGEVTITYTGWQSLIDDTTPQLGGNLDVNNFAITGNVLIDGRRPKKEISTTSYTVIAGDAGHLLYTSNSSAVTVNLTTDASLNFAIDTEFDIIKYGTGDFTLQAPVGVTLNGTANGSITITGQYNGLFVKKIAANEWLAVGEELEITGGTTYTSGEGININGSDEIDLDFDSLTVDATLTAGSKFAYYDDVATQHKTLTWTNLQSLLETNLDFLSSGDNISELVNDSGYITSAAETPVTVVTSNTTISTDDRVILCDVARNSILQIQIPASSNGKEYIFLNPNGARIYLGTDSTDSTPFNGISTSYQRSESEIRIARVSGEWKVSHNSYKRERDDLGTSGLIQWSVYGGDPFILIEGNSTITGSTGSTQEEYDAYHGLYKMRIKMDSVGGHSVGFNSSDFTWLSGSAPTVNTGANEETIIFIYNNEGKNYAWVPGEVGTDTTYNSGEGINIDGSNNIDLDFNSLTTTSSIGTGNTFAIYDDLAMEHKKITWIVLQGLLESGLDFDNYNFWTINGDTGTANISSEGALTITGGTNVTTSLSGSTLTIDATGGSTYTAGAGLNLTGTEFSLDFDPLPNHTEGLALTDTLALYNTSTSTYESVTVFEIADYVATLTDLDELADVIVTTLTTDDLLQWNGSNWVNVDPASIVGGPYDNYVRWNISADTEGTGDNRVFSDNTVDFVGGTDISTSWSETGGIHTLTINYTGSGGSVTAGEGIGVSGSTVSLDFTTLTDITSPSGYEFGVHRDGVGHRVLSYSNLVTALNTDLTFTAELSGGTGIAIDGSDNINLDINGLAATTMFQNDDYLVTWDSFNGHRKILKSIMETLLSINETQIITTVNSITSDASITTTHVQISHNVNASSNTITFTVNDATNSAFSIGQCAEFWAEDLTNDIDFVAAGSQNIISVDGHLKIGNKGGAVILQKRANNLWALIGDLKA